MHIVYNKVKNEEVGSGVNKPRSPAKAVMINKNSLTVLHSPLYKKEQPLAGHSF